MAKKSILIRTIKRMKLIKKYEEKRKNLKKLIRSSKDLLIVQEAQNKLSNLPINSSPVRYSTRCQQCGRSRSIYKKFALCRMCLRQQLMLGNVTGGRKSSW